MKKLFVIALGALAVASVASAEVYVQGNLGYSKLKTTGLDYSDFNKSNLQPSVAVGYKMGDWRAALDYTHYGKASSSYQDDDVKGQAKLKAQGVGLSAIYDIDVNSVVKPYVGARVSINSVKITDTYVKNNVNYHVTESATKLGYGAMVGANYGLAPNLDLDAALEYNRLGNFEGVKLNQYGLKVGLKYSF
ncbi:opacity family porin [Gallibacterium trehalosifermentans]|uniref:Opacity family porin n=1 Tax=Gallibacterium trehalosifermentans TaxID=516935 RepID=A0ABV6GZT0_9PAST